ncbi:GGDEF domain-containing protein [Vibrio sp. RC27]
MSSLLLSTPWVRFTLPLLLVVAGLYSSQHHLLVDANNQDLIQHLPYILFVISIFVAQIFKQSRMGMLSSVMLVSYYIIQTRLQVPLSSGTTLLELTLLSLLLPISIILTYLFKNTDLLNKSYFFYLLSLGAFVLWAKLIVSYAKDTNFLVEQSTLLTAIPSISHLPFLLTLFLVAIIGITAIYVLNKNRIIDSCVYTTILLSSSTFILFHIDFISSILFSLAGVMSIIYLIVAGQQMAFNDRLTNLPGRRALEIDMKNLGRNFSIAMLDVDHFKKFNDTYGHDTGDDVLKLVASRIQSVRGKAKAYRYGGEEFTIIFKGKDAQSAQPFLNDLRQDIADYEMVLRNEASRPKNDKVGALKRRRKNEVEKVNVTISIGVSDNQTSGKPNEVLKFADNALYKAKQAGRNRVEINQIIA